MINLTYLEYLTLSGSLVISFIAVLLPLFYLFIIRKKIRSITAKIAILCVIAVVMFITPVVYSAYAYSPWNILLPNGTLITYTHSSQYLELLNTYSRIMQICCTLCGWLYVVFLIVEVLEIAMKSTQGEYGSI